MFGGSRAPSGPRMLLPLEGGSGLLPFGLTLMLQGFRDGVRKDLGSCAGCSQTPETPGLQQDGRNPLWKLWGRSQELHELPLPSTGCSRRRQPLP